MKILHITNNLWSGGVTKFLENLNLEKKVEDNITILLLGSNDETYNIEKFKDINIIFLNQKSYYSLKNILKIREYIKKNDIVHVHLFPAQYIVILSSLFLNKKIIFTEHSTSNNRRKYFLFKYVEKYLIYKLYYKVICVSQSVKDSLELWIGKSKNIEVIENGININDYLEGKNISKELFPLLEENSKIICMIARFTPPKDHITFVNALKELPNNIKGIFIGVGELEEQVKEYVKLKNLTDRIKFCGYREDIGSILKSCDINVLASKYEGLATVVLEGIVSGTLTFGNDVQGINNIIENKRFLFEVGNYKELANKIMESIEKEEIQEEFIQERKKVLERFSSVRMSKEYYKIYEKICEKDKI